MTDRDARPIDLSMLLNQASYALANRLAAALEEVDVSVHVYCALAKAAENDYTQRELAERAFMDKTTMVVTLDEMERRGLATRRLSPADRRVRVVEVTPGGRRLLDRADRIVREVYDEVLDVVPKSQRGAFVRALERLVTGPLATPFHMEQPVRRRRAPAAGRSRLG